MRQRILTSTATLLYCIAPAIVLAEIDVVIFVNGDRLTGEVKSLDRGRLRFKTDATDTISIEWDDVAFLTSDQNLQVETENGDRFLGQLSSAAEAKQIVVQTVSGSIDLDTEHVVLMTPIEAEGFDRIDGEITAGYNFAKASKVQLAQLGLDLDFRAETRIVGLDIDTVITDSEDNDSNQRQSLDLNYTRLRPNRWLMGGVIRLDRNDELGLDLRTSVGAGGGRIIRQTNSATLQLIGGIQVSRENISGNQADEDTLEAFGTLNWDWFRYDTPELDLSTELHIIPNLTDTGRVRAELDIELTWEIVEDFFWRLAYYSNYDGDPVAADAEKNDYGVTTSLGWEF